MACVPLYACFNCWWWSPPLPGKNANHQEVEGRMNVINKRSLLSVGKLPIWKKIQTKTDPDVGVFLPSNAILMDFHFNLCEAVKDLGLYNSIPFFTYIFLLRVKSLLLTYHPFQK